MVPDDQPGGRERILEQAQRLFFTHGYHGVSIRDIVQACGLSNAALYYHFENKQMLFAQVFQQYVAALIAKLQQAAIEPGSIDQRLIRVATTYAQQLLAARTESHILARDLLELDNAQARAVVLQTEGQLPASFATVLEQGIASGVLRPLDVSHVSQMILGMINTLTSRRMFGDTTLLTADIELAIHTLLEGIRA